MKSITIKGSERESVGKRQRRPYVMLERFLALFTEDKPLHFSADEKSFKNLVYTPNAYTAVIDLGAAGKFDAVLQDIQFHPVTDAIVHVDFYQLFEDKPVTMKIPVQLVGNSPGVRSGGRLDFRIRRLTIKALPAKLPDFFNVDISKLKIGGNISVGSLLSDDYTIMHPASNIIVQVKASRTSGKGGADDEDEEEEGAEEAPAAEATEAAAE